MELFPYLEKYDYEQLLFCYDASSGLKAIIAIHDTTLGPALGGTRMWTYASEEAAIEDALRLAKGMTYKNAAAGLNLGGGKTVIIGDPDKEKNETMFRALGSYIQGLNGRYITAEDVGTTVADMDIIHEETDYVTGISPALVHREILRLLPLMGISRHEGSCERSLWYRFVGRENDCHSRSRKCCVCIVPLSS